MIRAKENRAISFCLITIVYIISTISGVLVYNALNLDSWLSLLIADVVATVVTFIFSLIFSNASVYDPYWSVQPIVITVLFASKYGLTVYVGSLISVILIWGIRLTANWAYTFKGLMHQDWRYTMLRETTGVFYPLINFIGIHMVPTLIVYACTLPAVYAIERSSSGSPLSYVFLVIALCFVVLQGISDVQMHKFRKNRDSTFIRCGLWKYSRHPNYLGEIGMWWGIGLSSVFAISDMPYLLCGALLNTVLFLTVSIPMADKRQSRKPGFEEYKSQTRMLLPVKKF